MTQQPEDTTDVTDVTDTEPDTQPGSQQSTTGSGDASPGVGSAEKDPADWVTGDEPVTGPQASYLGTLAREAGVEVPGDLTKAGASEMIDELQSKTGRGQ